MAEVGSAFVSILPSARGFGSKLQSEVGGDIDGAGKSMGSRFGSAFKVGALALMAGGFLAGKFLKGAIEDARESAVVTARTENVIRSMGLTAKVSAGQIGALATSISNKTGIDDEAIQSGQNLLLTFRNVARDAGKAGGVFDQTSRLMVDLSAAMGTDAKGAAIQLGKALNDPTKGISALTRVGVSFSAQQQEQIKKFQESGQLAKAQGIILGELKNQFGGAAAAMATPADRLKVTYGNLKEQIGAALIPTVDKFLNLLLDAAPRVSAAISSIGPAFGRVQAFLAPFVAMVQGLFSGGAGGGLIAGIVSFAQSIATQALPILQRLGAIFTGSVLPAITSVAQSIAANFLPVLQTMTATFTGTVLPAITRLATYLYGQLAPIFTQIVGIITGQVIPIVASLAQFFYGTLYPAVVDLVTALAQKLQPVFEALIGVIRSAVLPTIAKLLTAFRENQPAIEKIVTAVVKVTGKVIEFAAAILARVLPPVIRFAGFLLSNVVPAVAGVIGVVIKIIAKVIDFGGAVVDAVGFVAKFVTGVKDKFGEAIDFVKSIPGKIQDGLSGLLEIGKHAAEELINGLIASFTAGLQRVKDKVSEIAGAIKGFFPGSPVKEGPLTVWNDGSPGKYLMEMLAKGIESGKLKVVNAALDAAKSLRDTFRTQLDGIKSDFASLSSSIASSFTGNLFDAATGADFLMGASNTSNMLENLKKAFRKLQGWGLSSQFLSQLFASGNSALILDLAGGPRSTAQDSADLFGFSQSLGSQLGNQVARNQYGAQIDRLGNKLDRIEKAIKHVGPDVGRAMDHAAGASARRR